MHASICLIANASKDYFLGLHPFRPEGYFLRNSICAIIRFEVARSSTYLEELKLRINLPRHEKFLRKADLNDGPLKVKFLKSECSPSELAGPGILPSLF